MGFYRSRSGAVGGAVTDTYPMRSGFIGSPFMELTRAVSGEHTITVSCPAAFEEIWFLLVNATAIAEEQDVSFDDLGLSLSILSDSKELLSSVRPHGSHGAALLVARIEMSGGEPRVVEELRGLTADAFRSEIPGADHLRLTKSVRLEKREESAALSVSSAQAGELVVNLNWKMRVDSRGLETPVDLDLGCLFELSDGSKGAVQPLGSHFGSVDQPPWIRHLGDDTSGEWADGETLRINTSYWSLIHRLLVYAYICKGASRWAETDAVVNVRGSGAFLEVPLGSVRVGVDPVRAVCMLENRNRTLDVARLETFHQSQRHLDRQYGWNLDWRAGHK